MPDTATRVADSSQEDKQPEDSPPKTSEKPERNPARRDADSAKEEKQPPDRPPKSAEDSDRRSNRRIGLPGPDRPPAGGYTQPGDTQ